MAGQKSSKFCQRSLWMPTFDFYVLQLMLDPPLILSPSINNAEHDQVIKIRTHYGDIFYEH